MKSKLYLYLFLLCLPTLSFSQLMTDEGNEWYHRYCGFSPDCGYAIHRVMGDTIFDNQTYRKIYMTGDTSSNQVWTFTMGIRQDSSKKIWVTNGFESEQVMMDFSLVEGDTFYNTYYVSEPCKVPVVGVDSIDLMDGTRRKRIHLRFLEVPWVSEDYFLDAYWVEGIGSITGGFDENSIYCGSTDYGASFTCFFNSEEQVYGQGACFIEPTAVENLTNHSTVQIFPNPVSSQLQIAIEDNQISIQKIKIFDSTGRHIAAKPLDLSSQSLDVSHLKSGLYILLLETDSGTIFSKRIVVE